MAERQRIRLNGYIDAEEVPLLFAALAEVGDPRRRMARLRQLAVQGLMVESGQSTVVRAPAERPAPPPVERPKSPVEKTGSRPLLAEDVAPVRPQIAETQRGVTAAKIERSAEPVRDTPRTGRINHSMLSMIDTQIMK